MELISDEKLTELRELSGGNNDLIKVLLEKYLSNSTEFVTKIRQNIKDNDQEKIKFAIHTLKGSSLSLGLVKLGNIFTELNQRVKDGNFENLDQELDNIEKLLDEVKEYFAAIQ